MSDISKVEISEVTYFLKDEEARRRIGNAEDEAAELAESISSTNNSLIGLQEITNRKIDDAYVENGFLYMTSNGEIVVGPLGPFSGTGGGGGGGGTSGNNAVMLIRNTSGWTMQSIAYGAACQLKFTWSSLEDEMETGNGMLNVYVNNSLKVAKDVAQGEVALDVGDIISVGENKIKIVVTDVYENSKIINYIVTAVDIRMESTFDASAPFTGQVNFVYTPIGGVQKTVHIVLDGEELGTVITTSSGRQMSYPIPEQSHGSHTIEAYFTATITGQEVESNHLYYDIICLESGNRTPIIATTFRDVTVPRYTSLTIRYMVYDPFYLTTPVTLTVNGAVVSEQTVSRTEQVWTYRTDEEGVYQLGINCKTAHKNITVTVQQSEINVEATTEALSLFLSSYGRSNNEANPGVWRYEGVAAQFTDFNFASDGWQTDEDGITVLRVGGDARLEIPLKPFANDFRTTGKTIEIEFATRDVMDYDAVIMSCLDEGRGVSLTAQKATLTSEQSEIFTQYKENEHVRISFVVEKRAENRLVYCYINGIMSGVVQYPTDDDFSQKNPVNISVGSNDCTIDLYCIRIYDNNLTRHQVLNNWIADTSVVSLMLERYNRNNIFDAYDKIVISKLPNYLPYMVLEGAALPQYKGDKQTVSGYFVNPSDTAKNFTFSGAQADVQGTSSQYYARKNYKIKFKNGFINPDGTRSSGYAMNSKAVPTSTFTFKADVASSEGANNVELVRLYNDICPYKTPAQMLNPKVRQGIDGFPIVIFWDNGSEISFLGKYNFNNDKGTPEVFGFVDGDESWEVLNNTSNRVLWKSDDYAGTDWLNDFEARFPDTDPPYTDKEQLAEFASWVVSTDPDQATNNALQSPVDFTIGGKQLRIRQIALSTERRSLRTNSRITSRSTPLSSTTCLQKCS